MKNKLFLIFPKKNIFILTFFIACGLRFYHLDQSDLWFDEIATAKFSYQNIERVAQIQNLPRFEILSNKFKQDPHSSFYFLTIYFYTFFFHSDIALRILSVVFGLLSLLIFYKLSRLFFNKETSLLALMLMALSPFHLWYSQEARAYSMACFFSLCMIYMFMLAIRKNKTSHWIYFVGLSSISIFFSYFSILLLLVSGLLFLSKKYRPNFKQWLISFSLIILIILGFSKIFLPQISIVKNNFWIPKPTLFWPINTLITYSMGYLGSTGELSAGFLLFMCLFLFGSYSAFKRNKTSTGILLAFLFLPLIAAYVFSRVFMPIYLNRQLIIFSPYYFLFIAKGIESIPFKKEKFIAVIFICIFLLTMIFKNYFALGGKPKPIINTMEGTFSKHKYSETLEVINANYKKGDILVATDMHAYHILYLDVLKNQKIDPKSFFFLFIPRLKYFSKYDLNYLQFPGSFNQWDSKKIYGFKPFEGTLPGPEPINLHDPGIKRIWAVLYDRYGSGTTDKHYTILTMKFNKIFQKTLSKIQNNFISLELYEKASSLKK